MLKSIYRKIPPKDQIIKKCKKKITYFKNHIKSRKNIAKKNWFKDFEKTWFPEERNALKELKNFVEKKLLITPKDEIFQILMEHLNYLRLLNLVKYTL